MMIRFQYVSQVTPPAPFVYVEVHNLEKGLKVVRVASVIGFRSRSDGDSRIACYRA